MASRRTALVTGASFGVGAAIALALANDGFDVAVTATRTENLSNTLRDLAAAGARGVPVALQLQSLDSVAAALAAVHEAFGRLDLLVNNAGTNISVPAVDVTPDQFDGVMRANVTGTFFVTQGVMRRWIAAGTPGCIVNITSTNGLIGSPNRSTYGISKAALIHMTTTLAVEWAEYGIRVNSVAPGRLITESPSRQASASNPKYMEKMLASIPLHRLATVEEVAAAICFLASPSAASITGHTMVVDGGLTAT